MADPRLHRLVCNVCETKFQHPTRRKTCSDACVEHQREEQRAATLESRRSRVKECPECRRVFTWEEMGEGERQFEIRTCCSSECHRKHQKKETTARNSIDYHGVRLSIEDVCKLEQKSLQMIRLLMKKGAIPGGKWAEPELRAQVARRRPPSVPKDEMIKVRMMREQKDVIQAYARWRGMNTAAELLMMLAHQEMRLKPRR